MARKGELDKPITKLYPCAANKKIGESNFKRFALCSVVLHTDQYTPSDYTIKYL